MILKKYSATKMLGGSKIQKKTHTHVLIKKRQNRSIMYVKNLKKYGLPESAVICKKKTKKSGFPTCLNYISTKN